MLIATGPPHQIIFFEVEDLPSHTIFKAKGSETGALYQREKNRNRNENEANSVAKLPGACLPFILGDLSHVSMLFS